MKSPPRPVHRPAPVQHDNQSNWRHTPEVAALNTVLVGIPAAATWRLLGLAPGIGLAFAAVIAVALAYSGMTRKPRRLAMRSIVYRVASMAGVGVWFWWRTADFTGLRALSTAALILGGTALAAILAAVVAVRFHKGWFALGSTAAGLGFGALSIPLILATNITSVFVNAAHLDKTNFWPWIWHSFLALALFVVPMAIVGKNCASHEAELDETLDRALTLRAHGREMKYMQQLLAQELKEPLLRVVDFDAWDNGAGENYVLDAADAGITPDDINARRARISARLRLPNGCGVEAIQGVDRGQIVVAVSRVNKIQEPQPFPEHIEQRTIYNGIPIGVYRDGNTVHIRLRESSVFLWGQKRSGKTSTLYDIIAMLAQCTDTLIWVIDLGGGGAALPFLYPYAEGKVDRPAIDWVATTVAEAKIMVDFAYDIAVFRKQHYRFKKRKAKATLLPLDAELPQIMIVIDEGAEIMGESPTMSHGAREVRGKLEQIVRVAGDSGVNVIFSGLAATQEVIDRMTKEQLAIRIAMRCQSTPELAYGFDGDYGLQPADVPYQGSGFVKPSAEEGIRVFKAYMIEVDQMEEVAIKTAEWRPYLDEPSASLPAHAAKYEARWARTEHLLVNEDGEMLIDPNRGGRTATAVLERPAPAAPASSDGAGGSDSESGGAGIDWEQAMADPGAPLTLPGGAGGGMGDDDMENDPRLRAFREELDGLDPKNPDSWGKLIPQPEPEPERQVPMNGPEVLEALVKWHGPAGVSLKDIQAQLPLGGPWGPGVVATPASLHNWFRAAPWMAHRDRKTDRGKPYVHGDFVG